MSTGTAGDVADNHIHDVSAALPADLKGIHTEVRQDTTVDVMPARKRVYTATFAWGTVTATRYDDIAYEYYGGTATYKPRRGWWILAQVKETRGREVSVNPDEPIADQIIHVEVARDVERALSAFKAHDGATPLAEVLHDKAGRAWRLDTTSATHN